MAPKKYISALQVW